MSKNEKNSALSPDDDISGLFSRFGETSAATRYQDFPGVPRPVQRPRKPPVATTGAEPEPPKSVQVVPRSPSVVTAEPRLPTAAETPLAALFRRLLEARPVPDAAGSSPLKRVFGAH